MEQKCINSSTGEKLKYFRIINSYYQKDVAKYLGIATRTYKAYEKPNKKRYSADTLQKLARLYGVPEGLFIKE